MIKFYAFCLLWLFDTFIIIGIYITPSYGIPIWIPIVFLIITTMIYPYLILKMLESAARYLMNSAHSRIEKKIKANWKEEE